MSLSPRLSALKASQLKYAAFLMGIPSTGTKVDLESAIRHQIETRPLSKDAERIVSVDMGIRNLGICVLKVPQKTTPTVSDALSVKVMEWKRLSVTLWPSSGLKSTKATGPQVKPVMDPSAFNPSNLCKTAVEVAESLLAYSPSHILIERQRFRSGGASAVQEWTLRVNALESMLWAALETMSRRARPASFPQVYEVNPARVARFWCAPPSGYATIVSEALLSGLPTAPGAVGLTSDRDAKRTIDKKEKIAMVHSWLSAGTATPSTNIALEMSDEAQATVTTFLSKNTKSSQKRSSQSGSGAENSREKLDDLADCLLQGVAWMRWLANQQEIEKMFPLDFSTDKERG